MNQLIVAQLDRSCAVQSTLCRVDHEQTSEVNPTTSAFFLAAEGGQPVPNFKRFYRGLNMLGKHFTVRTLTGAKPTRHYTVCNVMAPKVYKELIGLLRTRREVLNFSELKSVSDNSLLVAAADNIHDPLIKLLNE